jgi:hypothetical protein
MGPGISQKAMGHRNCEVGPPSSIIVACELRSAATAFGRAVLSDHPRIGSSDHLKTAVSLLLAASLREVARTVGQRELSSVSHQ